MGFRSALDTRFLSEMEMFYASTKDGIVSLELNADQAESCFYSVC